MDTALLVFAGIIAVFALRGYFLGLPAVACRLASLIAAYAAAILLAPQAVPWVAAHTSLKGFAPWLATLVGVFLLTSFTVNLAGTLLIRFALPEERRRQGRIPATLLNAGLGVVVAILAVWFAGLLQGALHPEAIHTPSRLQAWANQCVASLAGRAVALKTPGQAAPAAITERLVGNPGQTVSEFHYMARNAALNSLLRDPQAQVMMHQGDNASLQAMKAFRELADDLRAKAAFTDSGFVDSHAADYDQALAERLTGLWQKVEAVRNEPRFQAITSDPDYRKAMSSGNVLALVNDERTSELARIVMSAQPAATAAAMQAAPATPGSAAGPGSTAENPPANVLVVHRWQDANGRWHFSDKAPE